MPDKSGARRNIKDLIQAKDERSAQQLRIEKARVQFERRTNPLPTPKGKKEVFKLTELFHSDDPEELKRIGAPETPVLISPYIRRKETCPTCKQEYGPLFYGVGHTTESAHHDIIYTTPDQPVEKIIRGGGALLTGQLSEDERKFTGTRAHYLACSRCSRPGIEGTITTQGYVSCSDCARESHPIEWTIDEGDLRFMFRPGAGPSQAMDRYIKGQEEVGRLRDKGEEEAFQREIGPRLEKMKRELKF